MKKIRILLTSISFLVLSCSLWEYDDPSSQFGNSPPETYLTLIAQDTIWISRSIPEEDSDTSWIFLTSYSDTNFIVVDSVIIYDTTFVDTIIIDTSVVYDTTFYFIWGTDFNGIESFYESVNVFDTSAFHTITTSRKDLNWWGEDSDGDIIGYQYRWDGESDWSSTQEESGLFYVPIRTELDVFGFEIRAMDNDSLVDLTPAKVVFPIKNSPPSVSFRYLSNPQLVDIQGDTAFTFPTRTFVWNLDDQDGVETIINVFYALDEPCDTCWIQLGPESSVTLNETELDTGFHTFYLKAQDIAGAESSIISFPDTLNEDEPSYWKVMHVVGDVLLVDDFPLDGYNNSQMWFRAVLDSILGEEAYSVWEIGDELPFSSTDITANLNYFDHVIWYAAYNNTAAASDTYLDASSSIVSYIMGGGNLFLNAPELQDSTFGFFPIDSSFTINTNGRLMMGRTLYSQVDSTLDLELSKLIAIRVKSFIPASGDGTAYPYFEAQDLYHLQEPESGLDTWTGTPNVCSMGKFIISPSEKSGKIILMSIPLHNGYDPTLEGNGTSGKFIEYLLKEAFLE